MAKNVVIIGGGASGLMAAIWASRLGAAVTVLEKNDKPGRKLLATGNGRCNFTNRYQDASCYRTGNQERASRVLEQFTEQDTARGTEGKCNQTKCYDFQSIQVQECFCTCRCTYRSTKQDNYDVHHCV